MEALMKTAVPLIGVIMRNWTFLHLFVDEDGVSRVDPNFTRGLMAVDFAPPALPMFVTPLLMCSRLQ